MKHEEMKIRLSTAIYLSIVIIVILALGGTYCYYQYKITQTNYDKQMLVK